MFQKYTNKLTFNSKLLLKNSAWVYASNLIKVFVIFIKSILITQFLGPKHYGSYLTILAFILSVQAFFNFNLNTAFIKFGSTFHMENQNKKLVSIFKLSLIISIFSWIISVIVILILLFFTNYLLPKEIDIEKTIFALGFSFGFNFIDSISESFLRLFNKFKVVSFHSILTSILDLILLVTFLFIYKPNFIQFLYGIAIIRFLSGIFFNSLNYFYLVKKHSISLKNTSLKLINEYYNEIKLFVSTNYGGRLLKNLIEQSDVLILGYLSTQREVGLYGVGKRIGYAVLSFVDPLINAIFPQLNNLIAKKEFVELKKMILQFSKLSIVPILFVLVFSIIFRENIVILLFGKNFLEAANIFILVLSAALIASFTFWNISLLISLNEVKYRLKMNIGMLILTVAFSLILVPNFGAKGTAFVLLVIKLLESVLGSFRSLKIINQKITTNT